MASATALLALAAAWLALRLAPLPARLTSPPSTVIRYSDASVAHVFLSPDDKYRIAAHLDRIDPAFVTALVRFEDRRFRAHLGVDPLALVRAAALDLRARHVVSGGSTLTMQLVRVLEPRPRTLRSKAVEALRALQLETRLSKDEILEGYLTFAPYGGNVEGIQAASLACFGHGAEHVSPTEIATLLAIPQKPGERAPDARHEAALRGARDRIAEWLAGHDALPLSEGSREPTLALVRKAPAPVGLRPLPREIPHAATWLRAQHPGITEIDTTLDRSVQHVAEARLAQIQAEMAVQGVHDGAVVVVDHQSGDVKALVGNFDFTTARAGSQIAGFDVARSTGSTLKPFLHAMAIDRGLALPDTLVSDVPVRYGSYEPENYTGTFAGIVPLGEALSWSLNVPFVDLLARIGVERFVATLRGAGVEGLAEQPGRYGLSAAIGGIETRPLDLASLYAALAERGRVRALRCLAGDPVAPAHAIMSPGAAWLTRQVLSRRDRPDFPQRRRFTSAPTAIHWKTGTSQGHLDAWAAGSGPRYTVVTWLGNFDRTPSAALVGSETTAPLLFDILEALAEPSRFPPVDAPTTDLASVEVCAYSGLVPGAACSSTRRIFGVRGSVPTAPCLYHVALDVDLDTGLALEPSCRAGRRWETRTFMTWPATVLRFLSDHDRAVPRPPSLDPACAPAGPRRPPAIVSPPTGQVVLLLPGLDASRQQVPLMAENTAPSARHSWFVDGDFLGTLPAEETAWWTPGPGRHHVVVVDDAGAKARASIEVRVRP